MKCLVTGATGYIGGRLVPELLDIAEQLKISGSKKLDKQELVYKILDKQAVAASEPKTDGPDDKPKRKRIIKTAEANAEEHEVAEKVTAPVEDKTPQPELKKESIKKEGKPIIKKLKKKENEEIAAAPIINEPENSDESSNENVDEAQGDEAFREERVLRGTHRAPVAHRDTRFRRMIVDTNVRNRVRNGRDSVDAVAINASPLTAR